MRIYGVEGTLENHDADTSSKYYYNVFLPWLSGNNSVSIPLESKETKSKKGSGSQKDQGQGLAN